MGTTFFFFHTQARNLSEERGYPQRAAKCLKPIFQLELFSMNYSLETWPDYLSVSAEDEFSAGDLYNEQTKA